MTVTLNDILLSAENLVSQIQSYQAQVTPSIFTTTPAIFTTTPAEVESTTEDTTESTEEVDTLEKRLAAQEVAEKVETPQEVEPESTVPLA